ncbi:hypothetical protein [Lichenibacterium ramalinae]|uniref:Uncharacterized protein n=1 Tax=Lichenibacterium ramalinae TaxID=2316527 RepID=A0A4Q2R8V8_9HYPH|nr:hypothetical protein [Lichenibacterium ramalinae]RYB02253.1 hypothetical protein D3272_21450 [Lichenibacterium ramalinae]
MPNLQQPTAGLARALLLGLALSAAGLGAARAQSTAAPPPTAPSAPQIGNETRAPADPGTAPRPAGGSSPAAPAGAANAGTVPLKGDTTPPGITKAGQ